MWGQTHALAEDMLGLLWDSSRPFDKTLHVAYRQRGVLHCERGDFFTREDVVNEDIHCTRARTRYTR